MRWSWCPFDFAKTAYTHVFVVSWVIQFFYGEALFSRIEAFCIISVGQKKLEHRMEMVRVRLLQDHWDIRPSLTSLLCLGFIQFFMGRRFVWYITRRYTKWTYIFFLDRMVVGTECALLFIFTPQVRWCHYRGLDIKFTLSIRACTRLEHSWGYNIGYHSFR